MRRPRRWALGAITAATLGACAPGTPGPVLDPGPSLRNQATLIGVTSRFDEDKFQGLWHLRGYLPATEEFDQLGFRLAAQGPEFRLGANVCDGAGICGTFAETLETKRQGKGRYSVKMIDGRARTLWVLWVDEGFRTAVIGNPAGTFAWIIDRAPKGGTDRIKAAREILDFNGYDLSQLKVKK